MATEYIHHLSKKLEKTSLQDWKGLACDKAIPGGKIVQGMGDATVLGKDQAIFIHPFNLPNTIE